jgi:L-iditol 2-dehydrogenase
MGAARVILTGTRDSRLALGQKLGADYTINVRQQEPVEAIMALTGGQGVDLAIECSGASDAPQQCIAATRRGGKILFVAFYPGPITLDLNVVVRNDVCMYATRGEGGNNVKRAVALAAAGRLKGAELVTHRLPLADIAEGFRLLRERVGDPLKMVFVP